MKVKAICIFLLILFYGILPVFSQSNNEAVTPLNFREITTEKGLSHINITSVVQDQKGYMWFGSNHGLNKYNGYEIESFYHNSSDSTSLSSSRISTLYEDTKGNLWVGTRDGGLNKYNYEYNSFQTVNLFPNNSSKPKQVNVLSIYEDTYHNIWVGVLGKGLCVLRNKAQKIEHFTDKQKRISITSIIEIDKNHLLLGSKNNGLFLFNKKRKEFKSIQFKHKNLEGKLKSIRDIKRFQKHLVVASPNDLYTLKFEKVIKANTATIEKIVLGANDKSLRISNIYADKDEIWCATKNGVLKINNVIGDFESLDYAFYQSHKNTRNSLLSNSVNAIYKDKTDILWVASIAGINNANLYSLQLETKYFHQLEREYVQTVYEDSYGQLWMGLKNGNLVKADGNKLKTYRMDYNTSNGLRTFGGVEDICEDQFGYLWIGSWGGGLNRLSLKAEKQGKVKFEHIRDEKLSSFIISSLAMYNNELYVGTFKKGLNRISFTSDGRVKKITQILSSKKKKNTNQLLSNQITNLYADPYENCLWVSSADGLCKVKQGNGKLIFEAYTMKGKKRRLSHNFCWEVCRTSPTELWVGTIEDGLNKLTFDEKTYQQTDLQRFTVKDGLNSNSIQSIVFDNEQSTLWLGGKGITTFNITTNQAKHYDVKDGLIGSYFRVGSGIALRGNKLCFVSNKGLNYIYSAPTVSNPFAPEIVLDKFSLAGKNIQQGDTLSGRAILPQSIEETKAITLAHYQNNIGIGFKALHYANPEKNLYRYKMEGVDNDWVETANQNVNYSNLSYGEYTFYVNASNSDGVWNEKPLALKITVLTPWWLQTWAFVLYLGILVLIIWQINRFIINRHKLLQQIELEQFKAEKNEELTMMKIRFFVNISHELRTPLTLIASPLNSLLKEGNLDDKVRDYLTVMERNADRLLRLFDQLLDFRKIETGKHKPQFEKVEVVDYIKMVSSSFRNISKVNDLKFAFSTSEQLMEAWVDKDSIEKIVYNLVSNAVKHTKAGGEVKVSLDKVNETSYQIAVTDTGEGISQEEQEHIFDRFYQTKDNRERGSGIGLALVKRLVEAHYGSITLSSEKGKGTQFVVTLPLTDDFMQEDELKEPKTKLDDDIKATALSTKESVDSKTQKHKILIVEDNPDISFYLQNELSAHYQVEVAPNGKEGLDKLTSFNPDLVISDVLMPEMNGLELCNHIKKNTATNHIPVILLTARGNDSDKLQGIESGADAYISKPFKLEILLATTENLITERKSLKQFFAAQKEPESYGVDPEKEAFMKKAERVVEKHLLTEEFDAKMFASKMNLTYSTLYNKLKKYENVSATGYIRMIRLKKAAELIANTDKTIKEIQFEVGFNDAKYFRTTFKKFFDISPSEYAKKYRKIN